MARKTRKVMQTLALSTMLLLGTALTVNAGVNQNAARSARSWSVSSYPGGDSSGSASDIRDGSRLYIYTFNYSSQPSGGQPIYVTSPQSPDRLGINSTDLRTMSYNKGVASNARIDAKFYVYSSTDRIMANGTIDA